MLQNLQNMPALVLNADFRPLNLFPLSVLNWEDVIKCVYKDHVVVVATYDRIVRSPTMEMKLPSVIAMKQYERIKDRAAFTRKNVYLRDRFRCQYCGGADVVLTFDHVVPRSKGGQTNWTNIVASCEPCNLLKGAKTEMQPMKVPREPTASELLALKRFLPPQVIHPTWVDYLPPEMLAA